MKRLLLLLTLLFPGLAAAQNSQYFGILLGPTGKPLAGATVTFCSNTLEIAIPCTSTINLFDATGAPISNPTVSDGRGNVNVWAPVGIYLMTVSGPGVTPYKVVVNFPGGGGGSSISPGTPGQTIIYNSSTTGGPGSCFDVAGQPFRCPQGFNSAGSGYYAEWVVGVGGVEANKLACRNVNNKAVTCAAGTTQGVLGVSLSTVAFGGTALVGFAGKLNVLSTTATTSGNWLKPSASVAGQVDDTGLTVKPPGTQAFLAETSVSPSNAVLTTFLSPDTLDGTGGLGSITPCTINGVTYYTSATTLNCITPPTANGRYSVIYDVTGGVSVPPSTALAGIVTRSVAGTTDTLLYSDRTGRVKYTSNSSVAVVVPQAGSVGFTSSPVWKTTVAGTGLVTFTPTTSTVNGLATFTQSIGQTCVWYVESTNYVTECEGARGFGFTIDNPSVGSTAYLTAPYGCKINGYALSLAPSGTLTVKFWKIADGSAIPTVANSINTSGVSISSGTHIASNTISDFTSTAIAYKDIIAFNVTAVATATYIEGELFCQQ